MRFQRKNWPDRFWSKVEKTDGCWLWLAAINEHGYGVIQMGVGVGTELAHRVAWTLAHGPIPEGKHVLHRCDRPPCVRDDHLFLGDQAANMADCAAKGRHPKNGSHYLPTGKDHHHYERGHKLTRVEALNIRADTGSNGDIAKRYGIDRSLVSKIKTGKVWV